MPFTGLNFQVHAHLSGNEHLLPGAPEPEWLHRRAEHARILAQASDERVERPASSIVHRLRLVFGRD